MDKHDRFIAINQTLPGLEEFLKVVLGSEPLSESANRQRIEFLKRLESVSRPPSLPPRPANLGELFRARLQAEAQPQAGRSVQDESSIHYRNDRPFDPIEFASQQRQLSRATNIYRSYVPQKNALGREEGNKSGALYIPTPANARDRIRDSIKSTSSAEDDLYERLSLKGISPEPPISPCDADAETAAEESFVFPTPPKTPHDQSSGIYGGARAGSFRASGGKGKMPTGWFKKEAKVYEEVYVSNLREPVIKGYLKDVKTNKRRWCVLQDDRLHIFKNQEDPAIIIINLPDCNIAIDDKKKISYSFRLNPADGPGVSLAIEDGCDLSPWMSAIMAAAVRRGNVDRPNSPLDGAFPLEESRLHNNKIDGGIQEEEDDAEDIYEKPMDCLAHGSPIDHSTPTQMKSHDHDNIRYDAPLPPLPDEADDSSSESSSDEDESVEKKEDLANKGKNKKIYDKIPSDLLAELLAEQQKGTNETNKSQDSVCDRGSANDQSHDFVDSNSEHSGNVSNRHSYTEALASDDTGSSEPRDEKSGSLSRKRTSTVLSNVSLESVCSDVECTQSHATTSEKSGFKVKRRRRLIPPDAELQFLQDPSAMHSGILYKKRRLGVWSKRYCKIVDNRFKCYRNPGDAKPSLDFPILGYDISLIDSKESRKSYCIKISHPSKDTYYFATDSRVSVERWIEVLSLVATGRVDVIAPYPPYFCGGHSGDEMVSKSQESLLSSEGRLSDDDSADTLDELDPPSDKQHFLRPVGLDRKDATPTRNEVDGDTRIVETPAASPNEKEVQIKAAQQNEQPQSSEEIVKARVQKKRKEKPSDKEGTKTPSTMSPPHSMFIGESASGEAKPEPVNEEDSSLAQATVKESSEEASTKKDRRWTETLKKKQTKTARGHSIDHRLRGNTLPSSFPESSKNKILSIRRKNSQSFAHLVALFDKEGRFCGYLTEAKYKKYGTTQLRRWCVVKNGVLNLYNNETEEVPHAKLSLVDMWLTDRSDESRNKFAFALEDKEGNETILQTSVKEDYQKWMGVLEVFTELRVERPNEKEQLKKTDSSASEDGEGSPVHRTKTTKQKEDIPSSAPSTKVRSSLRMKLSHRVNVRDIFRKSHSSYDMEAAASMEETPASSSEIDTVAVFGGLLTEVFQSATGNDTKKLRWCSVKEKELLVFSHSKASDPLRKMPLLSSVISNLSDAENNVHRLKVQHGNDIVVLEASDSFDLNRWLRMLTSSTERRNSSEDERPKCVGRLTSPTFTKKKFLVRRTRSEAFPQQPPSDSPSTTQWYIESKEHSVNTDRLMSGYLQQVRETSGARTLLRRWCVATSETFTVYDNQNSKKASYEWPLSEMALEDHSDLDAGSFGFSVLREEEKLHFQVIDEDSARHWLSVLSRYCHTVAASETVCKKQAKSNALRREERRRSASDNDLKSKANEKEANVLEILSEGRASGRKLARRVSDDGSFFRKFSKPDLFKSPRRGSTEKLDVKLRENPGRAARNSSSSKRFSCGSLFDSEGKYSGHLMELITSDIYSSQVRRWCLQSDDYLYVYEHESADKPLKRIPLFNAKVVDRSDLEACVYRFRIEYGENNAVFFRAMTRTDLEKWTTVISVKTAVLQDRSERQSRRSRTLSSEMSATETLGSSESRMPSLELKPSKAVATDCSSPNETLSVCSGDSVFGMEGDNTARIEDEPISTRSSDLKSSAFVEEPSLSSATPLKDGVEKPSTELLEEVDCPLKPCKVDGDKSTISDSESASINLKTVSNLSHIDDLSHIYENFLAFASEMVERSPEFQQQLYHIYENVSLVYDRQHSGDAQSCNGVATSLSTSRANSTESKLQSPSADMSSEFEKISLQHTDDTSYRYSGICDESELENLDDSCSELEQCACDSVAESSIGVRNGASDEGELSAAKRDAEAVVLCRKEGSLKSSVGGEDVDDLGNNTLVQTFTGEGEQINEEESFPTKEQHAAIIESHSFQDYESKIEAYVHAVLRRIVQDVASSERGPTDLPPCSEGDTPDQQDESSRIRKTSNLNSSQVCDTSMAVALQSEENSFRFIDETRNEQVWVEIEGEEVVKPIVETRQILHATCTSTFDGVLTESDAGGDQLSTVFSEWSSKHEGKAVNVEETGAELNTSQQTPMETEPLYLIEAEEGGCNNSKAPAAELVKTFSETQIREGGLNDTRMKRVEENSFRGDLQNAHQVMMVANDGVLNSQECVIVEEPHLSSLSIATNNLETMEPEGLVNKPVIGEGSSTGDDNIEGTDTLNGLHGQENAICLESDFPGDLQDQQICLQKDLKCGLQGEQNDGTAASQNDVQDDVQNEKTTNDSERLSNGLALSLNTNIPEELKCEQKDGMAGDLQPDLSDDLKCERKDGMAGDLQPELSDDFKCEQEDGIAEPLQPDLSDDLQCEQKDGLAGVLQPALSDDLKCEQKDSLAEVLQPDLSDDLQCEQKDSLAEVFQPDLSSDLQCEQKDSLAEVLQPDLSDDLQCEQKDSLAEVLQPDLSDDLQCEQKDGMAGALPPDLSYELKGQQCDNTVTSLHINLSDDSQVLQDVGAAASKQTDLLVDELRPGEVQTLLSCMCETECAQKGEEAWVCINNSASTEIKNFDQENRPLVSPSIEIRSEDSMRQETCSELVRSEEQGAFLDARVMDLRDSLLTGPHDFEREIVASDSDVGVEYSRREVTCIESASPDMEVTLEELACFHGSVTCMNETFSSKTQNIEGENRQVVVDADVDATGKNVTRQKTVPEQINMEVKELEGENATRQERVPEVVKVEVKELKIENAPRQESLLELVSVEVKELEGENATRQEGVLQVVNVEVKESDGEAPTDGAIGTACPSLPNEVIVEESEHESKGGTCHAAEHCTTSYSSLDVSQENIFDTFCENSGEIEASVDSESNLKCFKHKQEVKDLDEGVELGIELRKDCLPGNSDLVEERSSDSILERRRSDENTRWRSQELIVLEEEPQVNVKMLSDKASQDIRSETLCDSRSMQLSPESGFTTTFNDRPTEVLSTWSHTSSFEEAQDLTKSQIDIIKAVTAAFEEILELHGDGGETEDTKL